MPLMVESLHASRVAAAEKAKQMASGSVHGLAKLAPLASRADPVATVPRGQSFRLVEIGFPALLPVARALRDTVMFVSVGFDPARSNALQVIYAKNSVAGVTVGALDPVQARATLIVPRLERLTGDVGGSIFVCLSLLGCTAALVTLGAVFDGTFRPGLIHSADADSFDNWPQIRAALLARDYIAAGDCDGAELFIDLPLFSTYNEAGDRPTIATFDVFDTLIARRCLEPWRVFQAVGEAAGLPDFVEQRRAAESRALDRDGRHDAIYGELAHHYGWSATDRARIQALELQSERAVVVPIAENLARVKDGDLLVADTSLSEAAIRTLLTEAGLSAQVGVLVEPHGKSSGRIWPRVTGSFKVTRHLGSNPHADVGMAARFGLDAELTQASDLSLIEQTLLQTGLRDLALLCREARLISWHADPTVRALQLAQSSLNFPLLLLASVALARRATALDSRLLLFSSRNCNLWQPLFEALQPQLGVALETRYLLTSRLARRKGSEAYLAYARAHLRPEALVVDLCGTGWSLASLAERLGLSGCNLFLVDHCPPLDVYERAQPTPDTCRVHRLFAQRPSVNSMVLELANRAEHGMVLDMRAVGGTLAPVFGGNRLSALENLAIREQRKCFLASIALLEHYDLRPVFDLDDASIAHLCASLYTYMSRQIAVFGLFMPNVESENTTIMQTLIA